jgi:copper transport protein
VRSPDGSTPLDDFLNSPSATDTGELLQRIGLFGSLFGVVLSTGLIAFLVTAHRGRPREVAVILRLVGLAGAVMLVGAAIELAGVAAVGDLGWAKALREETGLAPTMRLLGGLLIVFGAGRSEQTVALGIFDHKAPIRAARRDAPSGTDAPVRWNPASAFEFVGASLGLLSFWFDGHTISRGPRVIHSVVNLAHVSAGSVWFGGIVGIVVVGVLRRPTRESSAPDILRFSSVATVALIVVTLAGSLMTLFVIDGFNELTGTDWGRLLLVKVAAVGITASIGGYNHFVVVPALERPDDADAMSDRARATVTVEAVILTFVVAITVFLTSASTN